jgi:transglutaminase-like putative cysteine protease
MRYQVNHTTSYSYSEPVPLCHNLLHLTPRNTSRQTCLEHQLTIRPAPHKIEECVDFFGNHVSFFNVQERHHELEVTAHNEVRLTGADYIPPETTPPWEQVRDQARASLDGEAFDARQFIFDSPLVAASGELAALATDAFAGGRPWLEGVLDLMKRIHRDFVYDPTATSVSTPLDTVLQMRRGVCQDFAHLQIGCLRALGLPARYVSGYLLTAATPGQSRMVGADASHAWLAAWCPGLGWIEFDPTNNLVPYLDHITVAWGRDYSDVCPIKGVFVGGGNHAMRVSVDVRPMPDEKTRQ